MIGYKYNYTPPLEIMERINIIENFGIIEYSILIFIFILFISTLIYILPTFYNWIDDYKIQLEKQKKKNVLKRILLQKDMGDEIEKELGL